MKTREALANLTVGAFELFGQPQCVIARGSLVECVAKGLSPRGGFSRWELDRVNGYRRRIDFEQPPLEIPQSRVWFNIPRGHHVPRNRH